MTKKKAAIVSLMQLKEHVNNCSLSIEEAKRFMVPFMLVEGLVTDIYMVRVVTQDCTLVEKVKDVDLPVVTTALFSIEVANNNMISIMNQ